MKKYLLTAGCGFALLVVSSCNKEEIGAYTPIPKLHLGEPFTYKCDVSNYVQLEYDSLGQAAILNFYKEEITELDDVHYDEHTCSKHSIFRHDNFIGCFSADKIKMSARKYFCFNIPIDKNMAEGLFCRSPYHEEYIQTSASGNPEDLCH